MLKMKNIVLVFGCFLLLSVLGGCGLNGEQNTEVEEETSGDASGIMLAGGESTEVTGIIKSIKTTEDEVIITVENQDVTYRLSEDSKRQIEEKEVDIGSEVSFTTFSIGDNKETIEKFKSQ